MNKHKVFIGLPGSGKSTLGRQLAAKHQMPFFDLDAEVERKLNMRILEVFKLHGEAHFRKVEWEVFHSLLEGESAYIAVGGGLVSYAVKKGFEKPQNIHCIFLNPPLEKLVSHLKGEGEVGKRPLLIDEEVPLIDKLAQLKAQREASYLAWADEEWLNY